MSECVTRAVVCESRAMDLWLSVFVACGALHACGSSSSSSANSSTEDYALPPHVFPKVPAETGRGGADAAASIRHLTSGTASGAPLPSRTFPASRPVIISTASPSGLVMGNAPLAQAAASASASAAASPPQPSSSATPSTSPTLGKTPFLEPSRSAGVLAGIFVTVSLVGYLGLLLWRRILERKYGNREALVNDDEGYDVGDLKHFEL